MSKFSYSSNMVESSMTSTRYTSPDGIDYTTTKTETYSSDKGNGTKVVLSVFRLIFIILLVSIVFKNLTGSNKTLSFTGFLEWLQNYKPPITTGTLVFTPISGNWGIFEILRTLINMLVTISQFIVWIVKNLVNLVGYIGGFTTFLFS